MSNPIGENVTHTNASEVGVDPLTNSQKETALGYLHSLNELLMNKIEDLVYVIGLPIVNRFDGFYTRMVDSGYVNKDPDWTPMKEFQQHRRARLDRRKLITLDPVVAGFASDGE